MDCAVIYSEAALADLQQITAFIARDDAEVAERFANRLVDLAESLRSLPERGRPVKKVAWRPCDCVSPVSDLYRFERAATQVKILRFWHGARDPLSLEL